MIEVNRDHIAANLGVEPDDFEYAPFAREGGLGRAYQLIGGQLNEAVQKLAETLAG